MATGQQVIDAAKALNDATHTAVEPDGGSNGPALMKMLDIDAAGARAVLVEADREAAHRSTRARAEYDVRTDAGWAVTDRLLAIMVGIELGIAAERLRADAGVAGAAREVADLAARAVCEPRRFMENVGNLQQRLGQATARLRLALRDG